MKENKKPLDLNGCVIGGPAHGQKWDRARAVLTVPAMRPFPASWKTRRVEDDQIEPSFEQFRYRRVKFHGKDEVHHVWIPEDVISAIRHVLEWALRAPKP